MRRFFQWPGRRSGRAQPAHGRAVSDSCSNGSTGEPTGDLAAEQALAQVRERVFAEFRAFKAEIERRVQSARASSEQATLACGRDLKAIVANVRELVSENHRQMETELEKTGKITGTFTEETRRDIAAQDTAVKDVLTLADGIEKAMAAIHDLTFSTKLVAVNARIEAARLGEQGRALDVIAQQLRGLSQTIEDATKRVNEAIHSVRTGLPSVAERVGTMHRRTNEFVGVVEAQIKASASRFDQSLDSGDNHLSKVIGLSNSAWSHLQFQDPMAQMLETINSDLQQFEAELGRFLSGDLTEVTPRRYGGDNAGAENIPASGEVTLF